MSRKNASTASLWCDQSFVLYWLGRAISLLGTAITSVVLPILVYRLTASAFLTSLLATLEVLPYICFGLFACALADRTDRRRLMVGCDLLNTLLLYALWELCYTLTTTNGIALRQVVTPDHLQSRVNVYARMIAWGGTPFGAAVGGLLAQWTTIRTTYLVMAIGVALSIVLGWFSPLREQKMVSELAEAN
jgi:MFS family permease